MKTHNQYNIRYEGIGAVGTLAVVLVFLLMIPLVLLLNGFLVMIAMGILHSVFASVPAIGYWQSVAVAVALSIIGGFFKSATRD